MQNIMLATDFSERSDRALRRAVLLAGQNVANLDLVHVIDDDRPRRIVDQETTTARILLEQMSRSLERVEGVSCRTHVLLADPFAGLVEAVADTGPDLLVIGLHRRQLLRDAFVGTTPERTIRIAACPVMMVNGPPVGPYIHVMLTTDLSDHARAALRHFETLKLGVAAKRSVLNIFGAPMLRLAMSGMTPEEDRNAYLDDHYTQARRDLSDFMSGVGGRQARQIVRHDESTVADEILETADELKSDLIVVSTQGKGGIARMLVGSVAERVLRSSSVDVLAIPPKQSNG